MNNELPTGRISSQPRRPAPPCLVGWSLANKLSTVLVFLALLSSSPVSAQTDFAIQSQEANLEQEYRAELDKWTMRAYEGDRDAQFKVGVLFTNSQFDKADYEQAVYWYKQAARQGHILAQYNLGHQYLTGVGVAENQTTAMEWWLKAAEQEHSLAQFNIGRAYYLGIGLPQDHQKSQAWFKRAAANNEPKSIDILQQLGWDGDNVQIAASKNAAPEEPIQDAKGDEIVQSQPAKQDNLTSVITAIDLPAESSDAAIPAETVKTIEAQPAATAVEIGSSIDEQPAIDPPVDMVENTLDQASAAPAVQLTSNEITADSVIEPNTAGEVALETTALASDEAVAIKKDIETSLPIALYTNPQQRAVLIAIVDERDHISVQRESGPWSIVRSNVGFPVWVHGDFILVDGEIGKVTGASVNARSVPIVTNGTVVGKLKKDEWLEVVDRRDDWFRVVAPPRFIAWVKTSDLERQEKIAKQTAPEKTQTSVEQLAQSKPLAALTGPRPENDNDWLFSQAPETYTLQLASFDDDEKITEFESRAKFINNPELHRFSANGSGIVWTYYLYGAYADTESAQAAKLEIKQKLAWIRNFGQLQQNRCVAWKTQLPTPKELNSYCTGS